MRHPVHALFRVTALAALMLLPAILFTASRARAEAAPDPDEAVDQITQMNRDAITAYQAKKYEDARKILKQALDIASQAGLDKHPIKARTHIHFGIVAIVGFKQRDLGIKQFKKAIEIQSDIGLTKTLITPELTEAFNEAKGASGGPTPPTPATPPEQPPPPKPPEKPAEPEVPASGLVHEAVSEGKQGSAISVTVGVQNDLQFEKIILAYRPEGASEFLGREMKEVAEGRYGAEIPTSATMGGTVAYYIEAEDADGAPVAARGSVDNPLTIRLLGVGVSRREDEDKDEDEDEEGPEHRYFVAMLAGMGGGYATGSGDLNRDLNVNPAGLAVAGVGQIAPEFGYWLNSSLMLSLQLRYEYITGTTDIYEAMQNMCPGAHCHAANYAFAAFAKATWKFGGDSKFHPFFSLAAGGGRIRHVVSFENQKVTNCGATHTQGCIDTIGAGPVLLGPGGGLMYSINDNFAALVQLNSVLAFPDFTVHLDANLGLAYAF
jgi:hypothetical protein